MTSQPLQIARTNTNSIPTAEDVDNAYGYAAARALVRKDKAGALKNADSRKLIAMALYLDKNSWALGKAVALTPTGQTPTPGTVPKRRRR